MPLTLLEIDGQVCPILLCDHCGRAMMNGHGLMLCDSRHVGTPRSVIHYVHQGRCDDAFERAHPEAEFDWEELFEHLYQLGTNAGYTVDISPVPAPGRTGIAAALAAVDVGNRPAP